MNDRIKLSGWDLDGELTKSFGAWVTVRLSQLPAPCIPMFEVSINAASPFGGHSFSLPSMSLKKLEYVGQAVAAMLDTISALPGADNIEVAIEEPISFRE